IVIFAELNGESAGGVYLLPLAYLLIVLGFVMLVGELFLPSGVLLALSAAGIIIGLSLSFKAGGATTGLLTLLAVFLLLPAFGSVILRYSPKTRIGKRFFLTGPEQDATVASMPVHLELEQFRGRFGRAISDLRPAGVVDFDGRRVDCLSEGMM